MILTPAQAMEAEREAADQRQRLAHLLCDRCGFPKASMHENGCPLPKRAAT